MNAVVVVCPAGAIVVGAPGAVVATVVTADLPVLVVTPAPVVDGGELVTTVFVGEGLVAADEQPASPITTSPAATSGAVRTPSV